MTSGMGSCHKDTQETVLKEMDGLSLRIPLGGGSPALRNGTSCSLCQVICHLGDIASLGLDLFLWLLQSP